MFLRHPAGVLRGSVSNGRLGPAAEGADVVGGTVAEPGVELGGVLELLTAEAGDDEVATLGLRQGGEVAPEFLELGDGEDVFLSVAPALFHLLQGEVSREAGGELADPGLDGLFVVLEDIVAGQVKEGEGCPACDASLSVFKTIEVGHIFKLGTKYSEAMGASFLDENGKAREERCERGHAKRFQIVANPQSPELI